MKTEQSPLVDPGVASRPNNLEIVPKLLAEINALAQARNDAEFDRQGLLIQCRSLVQALETPRETMVKHTYAQPAAAAALTFGVDSGLWLFMAQNGDKAQTVSELASALKIDSMLLRAMGYLTEVGEDEYYPTNFSRSMSIPNIGSGYIAMLSGLSSGLIKFHEYSRLRGWKNPKDPSDTSMMHAYRTDKDVFSWLHSQGYGQHFSEFLIGQRLGFQSWMMPGFYPVRENLIDGASSDSEAPFLVDMGGNLGKNLADLKRTYPNLPGKLILQDLPTVIQRITDLDPSIVRMEHDFNSEQPIKGARAYYLHFILHDWPDDVCQTILSRIASAMKPGYSKLLINEIVMPRENAYWESTAMDIVMMTQLCAEERTLEAWHQLLEDKSSFKIVNVWSSAGSLESVIECMLR